MSRTKRNVPLKNLSEKEKKLVEKNKYHHPVQIKSSGYEVEFSQNAKKEAKKEKHRKQRHETDKEIKEQISDE